MPFSNVWSNIIPAGSDPANTADDELRQLRLDIDERMDTIVGDWSADPLFSITSIRKTVHWADGTFDPLGSDTMAEGYTIFGVGMHPQAIGTNVHWRMNMHLPVGATLQLVDARIYKDTIAAVAQVIIAEADDAIPSEFALATSTITSTTGWVNDVQSGLGLVVAQDKPLMIKINLGSIVAPDNVRFFQAHYEYDIPSALTGIVG